MPNGFKTIIDKIMTEYNNAIQESFTNHELANFVRRKPREVLEPILRNPDLKIKSSPGQSRWTLSPWIAILHRKETVTPKEGLYIVYLFSSDMKRVYLTLNHGYTNLKDDIGKRLAVEKLKELAVIIRRECPIEEFIADNDIILSNRDPGKVYAETTIFYKEYNFGQIPDDEILLTDLKKLLNLYISYVEQTNSQTFDTEFNSAPEGKRKLIKHYVRERNKKLVKEKKKKRLSETGELRCEICGFSFVEKYGEYGSTFIEAHHTKPISEMKDGEVTKIEDLALVCSNCHRMIHKVYPALRMDQIKEKIVDN